MTNFTQQTMTIKELSHSAGCSINTVRKAIKENFPNLAKNGKVTRLTKEQAFDVMVKLPKRNFVDLAKNGKVEQGIDAKFISQIVAETIKQLIPYLQPTSQLTAKQIPELPPVDIRSELNVIIRRYATKEGILYPFAWEKFYDRIYQRLHMNARVQAKNINKTVLDWAEENGYMELLYELAKAEFQ